MKMPRVLLTYPWLPAVLFAALFVAVIWFGLWRDRKAGEEVQKWRRVAVRLQADSAARAGEIKRADSVFVLDTITLTKVATRFRTVVDSFTKTDTALVHDTTFIRVTALADSTIKACYAVVESCNQRVAARDSLIQTLGRQSDAQKKLHAAELRAANPRVVPYVEAAVPVNNTHTLVARGGIELRLLNHFLAQTAYQMTTMDHHTDGQLLVGMRWTFR